MSYLDQNFLNCEKCIAELNKTDEFNEALSKAEQYTEELEIQL